MLDAAKSNKLRTYKYELDVAKWRLLEALIRGISIQWKGQRPDDSGLSAESKAKKMTAIGKANSFRKVVV